MTDEQQHDEEKLRERGLVLVREAQDLDVLQSQIIEARLTGEEEAEAYLYVIMPRCPACRRERPAGVEPCPHCKVKPEKALSKPVVGPTVDFKRHVAAMLNKTGRARLTPVRDQPPIVQDVTISGKPGVRVMVCVVDEMTGIAKWALKEELRSGPHAATVALEKAEGKALESHPSFNRKLVSKLIRSFLRRQGLDPKEFIIGGGGGGPWADWFARARRGGQSPEQLRAAVRERTGKGLSEVQTPQDAVAAAGAVDESARSASAAVPAPPQPAAPTAGRRAPRATGRTGAAPEPSSSPPPAAEVEPPPTAEVYRQRAMEIAEKTGWGTAALARVWGLVGSPDRTLDDYKRLWQAVSLMASSVGEAEAAAAALKMTPRGDHDKEG